MEELTSEKREKLILDNLSLVTYIVSREFKKYLGTDDFDDLIQQGYIGLIKAAKYFNASLGYKFSTYAYSMIHGEVLTYERRAVRSKGIRVGRSMLDIQTKIAIALREDDSLSGKELANKLGESEQAISDCSIIMSNIASIDETISSDTDISLAELLSYEDKAYEEIEYNELVDSIAQFIQNKYTKVKHRDILEEVLWTYVFFNSIPKQAKLAKVYGISQTQISRIIKRFKKDIATSGILGNYK